MNNHPTPSRRSAAAYISALCALLLAACSPKPTNEHAAPPPASKPPAPPPVASSSPAALDYGEAPQPDAPITYQPGVVLIAGGSRSIRSVGSDGLTFTIDGRARGARDLAVGKIMFVTSRLVGRVVALEHSGSDVTVSLGPALFTEVIRDARLAINQEIKWDDVQRSGQRWEQDGVTTASELQPREESNSSWRATRRPRRMELTGGSSIPAVYRSSAAAPRLLPIALMAGDAAQGAPGADQGTGGSQDPGASGGPDPSESSGGSQGPLSTQDPGVSPDPNAPPADCNSTPSPVAQLGGPAAGGHSIILSIRLLDIEGYWNTAEKAVTNSDPGACQRQLLTLADSSEYGIRLLFNLPHKAAAAQPGGAPPGWLASVYKENHIKVGVGAKATGKSIHLVGNLVVANGAIDFKQSKIEVTGIDTISLGMLAGADAEYDPRDKNTSGTIDLQWPITLGEMPFGVGGVPMVLTSSIKPAAQISIGRNSTAWGHGQYSVTGPIGVDQGKATVPSFQVKQSFMDSLQGVTVTPVFVTGTFELKLMFGVGIKGFVNSGPYVKLRFSDGFGRGSVLGLVVCSSFNLELDFGVGIGMAVNANLFKSEGRAKAQQIFSGLQRAAGEKAGGKLFRKAGELEKSETFNSDIEFGESLVPVVGPYQSVSPDVPLCKG